MRLGALAVSCAVVAVAGRADAPRLGTFEAEERSGATGCGGRARYKEGKHGGGGLRRRRRRGKLLRGDHGGGGSRAVTGAPSSHRIGPGGCEALRAPLRGGRARRAWTIALRSRRRGKTGAQRSGPGAGHAGGPAVPRRPAAAVRPVSPPLAGVLPPWLPRVPAPLPGRLHRGLCPGPRAAR